MWEHCAASVCHAYCSMSGKHSRIFTDVCILRRALVNLSRAWFELKTSQHKRNNVNLPASLWHVFPFDLNAQTRMQARPDAFIFCSWSQLRLVCVAKKEQRRKTEAERLVWVCHPWWHRSAFYCCPGSTSALFAKHINWGKWGDIWTQRLPTDLDYWIYYYWVGSVRWDDEITASNNTKEYLETGLTERGIGLPGFKLQNDFICPKLQLSGDDLNFCNDIWFGLIAKLLMDVSLQLSG